MDLKSNDWCPEKKRRGQSKTWRRHPGENKGRSCSGAATGKEHQGLPGTTTARRGKRVGLSEQIDFKLFASGTMRGYLSLSL